MYPRPYEWGLRDDFLREDIESNRTEVCNTLQIVSVVGFCPLVTLTAAEFILKTVP